MDSRRLIKMTLKALYGQTVIVKRADGSWIVTGQLTEDTPDEILVIGELYTIGIDVGDIRAVSVVDGFHPIVKLKEPEATQRES